jgi:hypothetical protein
VEQVFHRQLARLGSSSSSCCCFFFLGRIRLGGAWPPRRGRRPRARPARAAAEGHEQRSMPRASSDAGGWRIETRRRRRLSGRRRSEDLEWDGINGHSGERNWRTAPVTGVGQERSFMPWTSRGFHGSPSQRRAEPREIGHRRRPAG